MADRWRLDDLPDLAGRWMARVDSLLIPMGWMFGMIFFVFGAGPIFTGDGGNVALLALGISLLALSRGAAAGTYARRNRCRCGEADRQVVAKTESTGIDGSPLS
jgi:hypothetical protein